ncbi:MAG: branched-chain amino acid transport system ATP-binding protein [Solirubrobacteraceae bacterium]|jgi:branched-chain amino acid transport system ATP-binding protein|nr:branched-chain amino acid transport system ATP-binding protein [Solirubrobacteraceae bacterium]MEA2379848.1 branched-chain amino acid transport system ATP-binding protein [Thermoleophilaceae bacterium]
MSPSRSSEPATDAVTHNEALLEVQGLNVSYGPVVAVRDIDLVIREREIVTLLGPNGAGKTSTLNALMGLVRSTAGTMRFEGQDVAGQSPERLVKRGMTLTPEGRQIFARLTVAENLRLGQASKRASPGDEEEFLELFPILRERGNQLAGTLSGGQQQMLAIARSLMSRPRLLMLDEPSLGLAPKIVDTIFELIAALRDRGITILLVEQNVSLSLEIADRGYVLETGRLVLSGTAHDLRKSEDDVVRAYLGLGV